MQSALDIITAGGVETIDPSPSDRQQWIDAVRPLENRFIDENERLGLPAAAVVEEAKTRAAVYEGWGDQQLWDYVTSHPVPGVIEL